MNYIEGENIVKHNQYCGRRWNRRELVKKERAAYRAKREAEMAKRRFLSTMSHDMRTPLNAILGMTRLAAANLDDRGRVLDCLEKMECSGKVLAGLVSEVLEISNMGRKSLELKKEVFSVREFMRCLEGMMKPAAAAKKQAFMMDCRGLNHEFAEFDFLRLNQIMTNLISNAIKFTPEGGVIRVEVTEPEPGREQLARFRFCVSDTGTGIGKDFMENLFLTFEREQDGRIDKTGGCGIGMSMVGKLVELMEGRIEILSAPGQGTSVAVILDLNVPENGFITVDREAVLIEAMSKKNDSGINKSAQFAENPGYSEGNRGVQPDFCGKHFLLIEDNELNLEIARELLQGMGAAVDTARDGNEGVECFRKAAEYYYDLILTDIHMPVMNGYEAARMIRNLRNSGRRDAASVPILAMTADAFAEDVRAAKEAGMTSHLAKPLDFFVMKQEISRALDETGHFVM